MGDFKRFTFDESQHDAYKLSAFNNYVIIFVDDRL